MIKNYFRITLRTLWRNKGYSAINLFGLAIGMAACLLMLLYVQFEWSYDRFHANADRIYRITETLHLPAEVNQRAHTAPPFAPAFAQEFPEIEKIVRLAKSQRTLAYQQKKLYDINLITADSSLFEIFSFPMVKGNRGTALDQPYSVVLTESTAKRYFGEEEPMGKTMTLSDTMSFVVTGIIRDISLNAHFTFDGVYSRSTMTKLFGEPGDDWFNNNFYTYLLLKPNVSARQLEAKIPALLDKYMGKDRKKGPWYELQLQPITDIHLKSEMNGEAQANSSMAYLYTFASIAVFVLLIACINFMNLSTARSSRRAKEVGVRKVVGAARSQLVRQFLGESLLLSMAAFLVAVFLVELTLPTFNVLMERKLTVDYLHPAWLLSFLGIAVMVGLLAGTYPAFFLSSFQPVEVLKGKFRPLGRDELLRKGLVVFQFAISICLIVGMGIVTQQLNYLRTKKLGFDKEQLIVLPVNEVETASRYEAMKHTLLQNPRVISVSASANPLGRGQSSIATLPEGAGENDITSVNTLIVDQDFLTTHRIALAAGRDFSPKYTTDPNEAFLVNEAAVKLFGWGNAQSAIGKKIDWGLGKKGRVIGVVKDFNYFSLHRKVEPLLMHIYPDWYSFLTVRIRPVGSPGQLSQLLASLEKDWKQLRMKGTFDYFFLDEDFDKQYQADQRLASFFRYFAGLAIFIACLGLFGLAAFTAEQRTKEIGIRKVLGASTTGIVSLLSKDFIKLVLIANVHGLAAGLVGTMDRWLQGYRLPHHHWLVGLRPDGPCCLAHCPAHGQLPGLQSRRRQPGEKSADGIRSLIGCCILVSLRMVRRVRKNAPGSFELARCLCQPLRTSG